MEHTLDIAAFRVMFPAFADPVLYPDAQLTAWWSIATCAISDVDNCELSGDCLQTILNLMLAHLGLIFTRAADGNTATGVQIAAAIDKVSIGYAAPPYKSGWQAWLSQTPYGLTLWAMLGAMASGGFYIGGMPEQSAFRKAYGSFY